MDDDARWHHLALGQRRIEPECEHLDLDAAPRQSGGEKSSLALGPTDDGRVSRTEHQYPWPARLDQRRAMRNGVASHVGYRSSAVADGSLRCGGRPDRADL